MRIICTNPSAGEEIDGVKFFRENNAIISEEIDQSVADKFLRLSFFKAVEAAEANHAVAVKSTAKPKKAAL